MKCSETPKVEGNSPKRNCLYMTATYKSLEKYIPDRKMHPFSKGRDVSFCRNCSKAQYSPIFFLAQRSRNSHQTRDSEGVKIRMENAVPTLSSCREEMENIVQMPSEHFKWPANNDSFLYHLQQSVFNTKLKSIFHDTRLQYGWDNDWF